MCTTDRRTGLLGRATLDMKFVGGNGVAIVSEVNEEYSQIILRTNEMIVDGKRYQVLTDFEVPV